MAPRPCIVCGAPCARTRCPRHRTRSEPSLRTGEVGRAHKQLTATTIDRHVAKHGWICPGWRRPAHEVPPGGLTGDHIIPRSVRPDLALDPKNYGVLCPLCNTTKGNRFRPSDLKEAQAWAAT